MDIQVVDSSLLNKTFYEIVIDSIAIGIIIADLGGNILTLNKAAEKMWDFSRETDIGFSFLNALAEHERNRMKQTFDYVIRTGKTVRANGVVFETTKGKTLCINCYASLFQSSKNEKFGVAMWTEDITGRKKLEEEIQRADKLAALGQLSLGISHEIRTPIGSIKALATLIKNDLNLDQQKIKYLNVIIDEANNLDRLSRELLDFAGSGELKTQMVNISVLMNKVLFLAKLHKPLIRVEFEEYFQEKLPPVIGNPERLSQMLFNLIINAMDAIEDDGSICINIFREQSWLIIKITDSGIGIPSENISKIFDPFYTTKENGSGLGLSIVHTIVTDHKGHIYVESKKNFGTTFIIHLPIAKESNNCEEPCSDDC